MLKRLIAPTGRWFVLLATIPKAPLRLPWAMRDLPLRGVLSLKKIQTKPIFGNPFGICFVFEKRAEDAKECGISIKTPRRAPGLTGDFLFNQILYNSQNQSLKLRTAAWLSPTFHCLRLPLLELVTYSLSNSRTSPLNVCSLPQSSADPAVRAPLVAPAK